MYQEILDESPPVWYNEYGYRVKQKLHFTPVKIIWVIIRDGLSKAINIYNLAQCPKIDRTEFLFWESWFSKFEQRNVVHLHQDNSNCFSAWNKLWLFILINILLCFSTLNKKLLLKSLSSHIKIWFPLGFVDGAVHIKIKTEIGASLFSNNSLGINFSEIWIWIEISFINENIIAALRDKISAGLSILISTSEEEW